MRNLRYSIVSTLICLPLIMCQANSTDTVTTGFLATNSVVWTTPSKDSKGSMPIGNGNIEPNVWIEKSGNLLFCFSKTDAWSENCRLLKLGKARVSLNPNPFQEGCAFSQTLDVNRGERLIRFKAPEQDMVIRFAIGANHPVVTVDIDSDQPVAARVSLKHWRKKRRGLQGMEAHSAYGLLKPTYIESDTVMTGQKDRIVWYHRNEHSIWKSNLKLQARDAVAETETDSLLVKVMGGDTIGIAVKDIKKREKVKQSLMPSACALGLSAQEHMDAVAYLPSPTSATAAAGDVRVLIVTGTEHPAHNWKTRTEALKEIFAEDKRFKVTVSEDPEFLANAAIFHQDVILLNFYSAKKNYPGKKSREQLQKFVEEGGGLFVLHFACGAFHDWPEYANLTGLIFTPEHGYKGHHDRRQPFLVNVTDREHAITKGLKAKLQADDELYYCMGGKTREFRLLATARSKNTGKDHPMAFCLEYGKGRVFNTPLGHDARACKLPDVAELIRRGAAWAGTAPKGN